MRRFLLAFVIMLSGVLWGQNAIVGTGFSNGWGSNGTTNNYEYLSSSSGTSYIKTDVANGTGNQYFRFGIEWGGTVKQVTITEGSDVSVSPETEYQLTMGTGGTNSGSMYLNVSSTSHNYVFKTEQAGSSPSGKFIIFLVQGTVRSVTSVTAPTAYINQDLTVTANLDGSLSAGQGVYLRYTSNDFVNSSVLEMMGSGTTYTANIPAGTNTSGATIKYYVFTSGDGLTIDPSKADWYTININNNSGNNYSYIPS
ncbi:MAG: hypothetical protein HUU43_17005, partial [Ignavibacteriaceae bacterium]|nr:hypothetical protein [Ignavibacteriaceae bacterium]